MNNTCSSISFEIEEKDDLFINDTTVLSDKYAAVYESQYVRFAFVITYIVSFLCVPLVAFVIWFERSGQAGSFRTMVNQLASFNLDQVH